MQAQALTPLANAAAAAIFVYNNDKRVPPGCPHGGATLRDQRA